MTRLKSFLTNPKCGLMIASLLAVGCADEIEPGALTVTWRTAGLSCADGAITEVRAQLFSFSGTEPVAEGMVDCDARSLRLDNLKPGGYSLVLQGFQDGCWTHGARREQVTIRSDDEAEEVDVPLDRRRRAVALSWAFAEGGSCDENGVAQIEVEVAVRGTITRVVPTLCRPGMLLIPDVGPGSLFLTLLAYDVNGTAVMRGQKTFVEGAFDDVCEEAVEVEVPLSVCTGPTC